MITLNLNREADSNQVCQAKHYNEFEKKSQNTPEKKKKEKERKEKEKKRKKKGEM